MTDMDREIRYVFKMVDNVSQTSADISASTAKASENVKQVTTEQERLKDATDRTTASFTRQESQFIKTTAILMSVKTAAASVTHGLITLGVVTGEDAIKLQKLNAGFQILTGFATGVKALQAASEMLKTSQMGLAVVETFRSVMQSPWKAALVGVGVGAAGGALAAMMAGPTTNNSQTQIIIENTPAGIETGGAIDATISGGRII